MRTLGLALVTLAAICGLISVFYAEIPFRIPLSAGGAGYWAAVLVVAGIVALLGSIGERA